MAGTLRAGQEENQIKRAQSRAYSGALRAATGTNRRAVTWRTSNWDHCQASASAIINARGAATLPRNGADATGLAVPAALAAQQLIMPWWQQGIARSFAQVAADATGVNQTCPKTSRTLHRMAVTNFTQSL